MLPCNKNLASFINLIEGFSMQIVGKIITLKTLQESYFQEYYKMFSPTVRQALGLNAESNLEETSNFLKTIMTDPQHKMLYCIFDNGTKKLIGSIVIRTSEHINGQLGSWVNENFWGENRYQEALKLVLQKYFETCDSIFAFVKVINIRSLNAHQKAGFVIQEKFKKNGYDYYKIHLSKGDFLLKSNP